MLEDWHIGPPCPRTHAQLAAQFVDAIDSSAFIATGNDDVAVLNADDVFLGFTLQRLRINYFFLEKVLDGRTLFDRADRHLQFATASGFHILNEIVSSTFYTRKFGFVKLHLSCNCRHVAGLLVE